MIRITRLRARRQIADSTDESGPPTEPGEYRRGLQFITARRASPYNLAFSEHFWRGGAAPPEQDARRSRPIMADQVSRDVGRRLRAVRRQQGLSLEDVEERSGGQWSASAIGAYERGYRTLSVERLRSLAEFYNVPMSVLLAPPRRDANESEKVVIDLVAMARVGPELAPLSRIVRSIQIERNDFNGKMLSIRRSDIKNLSLMYGTTEDDLIERLQRLGVIANLDDSLEDSVDEPAPKDESRRESDGAGRSTRARGR